MSATKLELSHNWHPAVHTRFGEQLYFCLIKLEQPLHRPVSEQIRSVLDSARVRYACEYSIFGYWDALVRVWLNSSSEQRLREVFARPSSNVADARRFVATQIRHFWSGDASNLLAPSRELREAIAERDGDVRLTVEHPDHGQEDVWRRLSDAGLLIERQRPATSSAVKFYVALQRGGGELPHDFEEQAVLGAIDSSGLAPRTSLYSGSGEFADYLVRCVADSYDEVLHWSATLDVNLGVTKLRPMTLLVANTAAYESDNVNDIDVLSSDDQATLDLLELGDQSQQLFTRLSMVQRAALNGLVRSAYELSEQYRPLRSKLRDLLRASIEDDRNALTSSLAFLLDFEWFLSAYLRRAWAEVYGRDWPAELAGRFEDNGKKAPTPEEMSSEKWTLGAMFHTAIESASLDDDVEARFVLQLGDYWATQMETLLSLRNRIAHGRLRAIQQLDDFAGEWGVFLREIMNVAALHFRCEQLTERRTVSHAV
jgi:hypothetical protein